MATMKTLNGYGFNATELNGKTASDYLQKTDTATNSAKLGGKAPEYYIQPRNLLDNSDFRNPVNQRGVSSATTTGYTIDRWILQDTGDGISISDDGVTFNATNSLIVFLQKINKEIRKVLIGKTITVAATDSSGNVGIVTCVVPNFGEGVDSAQNSIGDASLKVNIYAQSTDDTLHIRLLTDSILSPVTIVNIALYEGTYTADTLPPYVPKGYAAELAECQRYYIEIGSQPVNGWCYDWGQVNVFVPTPTLMRQKNPSVILNTESPNFYIGSTSYNATLIGGESISNGIFVKYSHAATVRGQCIIPEFSAKISADL